MTRTHRPFFMVVALALGLGAAAPVLAQCSYTTLSSGVAVSQPTNSFQQFTMGVSYWTAVSVRPPAGDDWDLRVYSSTAASPTCVSGLLASSTAGGSGVDFVIGDFNSGGNAVGTYYAQTFRFSGTGTSAPVEWDDGTEAIQVNGIPVSRSTGSSDVLECWDVFLEAGRTYTIKLAHTGSGSATLSALVYRNPANSPYWVGRSSAVVATTTTTTYTPPTSDWYGVVVVNDNGATDSYTIEVGICEAAVALTSNVSSGASRVSEWRSFTELVSYYTAVAVRSDSPAQDWDLQVYQNGSGSAYPTCFNNLLASSTYGSGTTDFVVGDFNAGANVTGTYYARAYPYGSTTSTAKIEWDGGADQLGLDQAPIQRSTDANDLIEIWDINLNGGQNFGVNFTHEGPADLKVLVFHNPGAGYWVGRSSALVESSGNTYFMADASDWYSVVVVNDNGQPGTYKLGISQCVDIFDPPSNSVFFSTPGGRFEVHPSAGSWMVFGALNSPDSLGNWDLEAYQNATGGTYPMCLSGFIAGSYEGAGKVDFLAGDFHVNTPAYYYFHTKQNPGASNNVKWGWDGDGSVLTVDAPPIVRSNVLNAVECWDVFLQAGTLYGFQLHVTSGKERVLLMRNPGVTPFWGNRAAAEFEYGPGDWLYTAPATGWYAVIVVKDDIPTFTSYTLGVYTGALAVDPSLSDLRTRLSAVAPNPTRGGVTFDYEIRDPGSVEFDVKDVAGRVVAQMPAVSRDRGRWSQSWNGTTNQGHRAPAGMYFVDMKVAGRTVGRSTVVLLQ